MNLHITFENSWPVFFLVLICVVPLVLVFLSSIRRNEITRIGVAHKDTKVWFESKRSPSAIEASAESKITRTVS